MSDKPTLRSPEQLLEDWERLKHCSPQELPVVDLYFVPSLAIQLKKLVEDPLIAHIRAHPDISQGFKEAETKDSSEIILELGKLFGEFYPWRGNLYEGDVDRSIGKLLTVAIRQQKNKSQ